MYQKALFFNFGVPSCFHKNWQCFLWTAIGFLTETLECLCENKIYWQVANLRTLEFGFQAEFSFKLPDKLAEAEIYAVRLWLVTVLFNRFCYFSMNILTFGVNFRSSESKSWLFVCLPLLLWKEWNPVAPSPAGSRSPAVDDFELPVLSELSLHAHPKHAME